MLFRDIIGQTDIKRKLVDSVRSGRISHAQFFLSQEGSGALQLALAYAQYILCENRQADDSCGVCNACIKAGKLIHPDVHFTFPVVNTKGGKPMSKDFIEQWRGILNEQPWFGLNEWYNYINAENKQGNITAEECYEIIRTLNLKSFESSFKIFIIWMPEYLGKMGNILLKSLEEPTDDTIFILVGESEENVLSTIVSRTQIIKIPRLTDSDIMHALMKRENLDESEARKLSRFAEGNYTLALRELEEATDISEKLLQQWIKAAIVPDILALNKWIDEVAKLGREKQKIFIRYVLDMVRDTIITKTIGIQYARLREEEVVTVGWLAEKLSLESLENWANLLDKTHYHIERNANPKLQLMSDSLKIHLLLNNKTIILSEEI